MANPVPKTFTGQHKWTAIRVPSDVVEALEHDLCEGCRDPDTTQLSCAVRASVVPTTVPASSVGFREVHGVGALQRGQECHTPRPSRRLVLVPQSVATPQSIQDRQWERDAGAESHNRFSPLQDTEIDAQEADLIPVPGSVLSPVPQSEPAPTRWASGPEFDQEFRGVPYTGQFAALIDDFDPTVEDPVPMVNPTLTLLKVNRRRVQKLFKRLSLLFLTSSWSHCHPDM